MRYYAEVPIHSPSGLVIGLLCVVDDKPREGLDTKGIAALKEISHAVMDHLDLVMSKVQRRRAERMIQGLGLFVEGSDSLRDWWMDSEKSSRTIGSSKRRLTINEQADKEFGPQGSSNLDGSNVTNASVEKESKGICSVDLCNVDGSGPIPVSQSSMDPLEICSTSPETEPIPTKHPGSSIFSEDRLSESNTNRIANGSTCKEGPAPNSHRTLSGSTSSSGERQHKLRPELESMLARAADLIREVVGLSGVSFFDPPIGIGRTSNYGDRRGRMEAEKMAEHGVTPCGHESLNQALSNNVNLMNASSISPKVPEEKLCKVLASSTRVGSNVGDSSVCSVL
jgi:hypothetical protein